jgi:hypothetical protein
MGVYTSLAWNVGTSLLWETAIEFREQISINDMITNPFAGYAWGEPMFQLGEFLRRSAPTFGHRAIAAMVSPVAAMHHHSDGDPIPVDAWDDLGLTTHGWHRFRLDTTVASTQYQGYDSTTELGLGIDSEILNIHDYGREGVQSRWVRPGAWTTLQLQTAFARDGLVRANFNGRALWAGYLRQRIDSENEGQPYGSSLLVGLQSGYELGLWRRPGMADDMLGNIGIAGPVADWVLYMGALRLRTTADAMFDFGMVHALGVDGALTNGYPLPDTKGPLREHGYYFALGLGLGGRVALEGRSWDLGAEVRQNWWNSLEGLDRAQGDLVVDTDVVDDRTVVRGAWGFHPAGTHARVSLYAEQLARHGEALGFVVRTRERRVGVAATYVF